MGGSAEPSGGGMNDVGVCGWVKATGRRRGGQIGDL